jgi:AraC family transcriptional regulator
MPITSRAIWQIESKRTQPLSLDSLADLCAVSPFHLSRTFRSSTGLPPMVYLRARRLSVAAQRLATEDVDILTVALDTQYGSHEAFTRAFASCFGVLPSTVRQARSTENLTLQEPLEMDKSRLVDVAAPDMKHCTPFHVVGLGIDCTFEDTGSIPRLWHDFNDRAAEMRTTENAAAYGVCVSADAEGRFHYVAGLEAAPDATVPGGMERIAIPAGPYAVFTHNAHISEIGNTVYTIWNKSLPDLGLSHRQAPDFERYDRRFDPKTGRGPVEIWIPVAE